MMEAPLNPQEVISVPLQTPELFLMKSKLPSLKDKISEEFTLCYSLIPIDQEKYQNKRKALIEKLAESVENLDVSQYLDIILGCIQGNSGLIDDWKCIMDGLNFGDKDLWDKILRNPEKKLATKFTKKNLNGSKTKSAYSLWQVKDINDLGNIYDPQALKQYRKISKQFGTYYRALIKFVQRLESLLTNQKREQKDIKELFDEYTKLDGEQKKYLKLIDKNNKDNKENRNIKSIQTPKQEIKNQVPDKQGSEEKSEEKQNMVLKEKKKKEKSKKKVVQKNNNEEIQDKVTENKVEEPIPEDSDKKKNKEQPSSQKKPTQSQINKQNMQKQYKPLDLFFLKKKPQPQEKEQEVSNNPSNPENIQKMEIQENSTDIFLTQIQGNTQSIKTIQELRDQFRKARPSSIQKINLNCYVNIVVCKSRLQYYDFLVTQPKLDFNDPLRDVDNIRYEDSSDQYSELVADSINEEMVQEDDQDEQQQSNSAIVPDSYCEYKSNHVFSSDEESSQTPEKQLKPQIVRGTKWSFFQKLKQTEKNYVIFGDSCKDPKEHDMMYIGEQPFPLQIKDVNEQNSGQDLTFQIKIEMYKEIHGSYSSKQNLVKKINFLVQNKISMNKLHVLLKDITQKKGTQRILKPEIIKQITEEYCEVAPNLQAQLDQIQKERENAKNQQMEVKRLQKTNQKEQKLQKLILEYTGNMTIKDILEYLKSNELKIVKSELNSFIKSHEGEQWENIKEEIKKNKLTKGRKPKKTPQQMELQEKAKIMNAHRSIQDILKQNQIDMANRPKKVRPVQQERMISEEEYEKMIEKQEMERQYQDQEDESYDIKGRKTKKIKHNKKRASKIPVIQCSIPGVSVRRNPRRNKNKSNKNKVQKQIKENSESQQKMQEQQNQIQEDKSQPKNNMEIQVPEEQKIITEGHKMQENEVKDQIDEIQNKENSNSKQAVFQKTANKDDESDKNQAISQQIKN